MTADTRTARFQAHLRSCLAARDMSPFELGKRLGSRNIAYTWLRDDDPVIPRPAMLQRIAQVLTPGDVDAEYLALMRAAGHLSDEEPPASRQGPDLQAVAQFLREQASAFLRQADALEGMIPTNVVPSARNAHSVPDGSDGARALASWLQAHRGGL